MKKIGVIGAMETEVAALRSHLNPLEGRNSVEKCQKGGILFTEGILNGINVVVVKSGVGKVNAALCAQRLIVEFGCTHIINTGIAGAMAEGLGVFDFVVSRDAVYHDMDATGFGYKVGEIPQMECSRFMADSEMIKAADKAFKMVKECEGHKLISGTVASGDQFISESAKKKYIEENFHPACVEMEGCAIAHACYLNGTPFAVIRCMSDMADETVEQTYNFNEDSAAAMSAGLVEQMITLI